MIPVPEGYDTVVQAVMRQVGYPVYPVQSLDPDASGLLLLAKSPNALVSLRQALSHVSVNDMRRKINSGKSNSFHRSRNDLIRVKHHDQIYTALVHGKAGGYGFMPFPLTIDRERKPMLRVDFNRGEQVITKYRLV